MMIKWVRQSISTDRSIDLTIIHTIHFFTLLTISIKIKIKINWDRMIPLLRRLSIADKSVRPSICQYQYAFASRLCFTWAEYTFSILYNIYLVFTLVKRKSAFAECMLPACLHGTALEQPCFGWPSMQVGTCLSLHTYMCRLCIPK